MRKANPATEPAAGPLYLTIDQGGQSSRVLVLDRAGGLVSSRTVAVGTLRPQPGWVEQDPVELLDSVRLCLAGVGEDLRGRIGQVEAAGLATQRSSMVCWDRESGEPLSPVISWQDRRGESQVAGLRQQADRVRQITGLELSSHYGASKIRWCLERLPAVDRARGQQRLACGPLASYLLFHLCRERPCVVDPAIAARTLLWDAEVLDWSTELLELFGIPRDVLPTCVPSRQEFGHLEAQGESIPVTVSTGDQAAALFAGGAPDPGVVYANLGTGAFVQRLTPAPRSAGCRLLDSVVWSAEGQSLRTLEGSINGCGSALAKIGQGLGFDSDAIPANADSWLSVQESPPLFLNGVSGLGSPYWVADFQSEWVGGGAPELAMAGVLESIVFLLQVNLEEMSSELGPALHIEIAGGLAASAGLCQRLADLSGCDVLRSDLQEATARGLAHLLGAAVARRPADKKETRFVPSLDRRFEARYRRWRRELESRLADSGTLRA